MIVLFMIINKLLLLNNNIEIYRLEILIRKVYLLLLIDGKRSE